MALLSPDDQENIENKERHRDKEALKLRKWPRGRRVLLLCQTHLQHLQQAAELLSLVGVILIGTDGVVPPHDLEVLQKLDEKCEQVNFCFRIFSFLNLNM